MPTDYSLIQGTLDALILKTLMWGPRHGYAIARWIKDASGDALDIEDRALYLALHRLEDQGWVEAEWGITDAKRRAKFSRLTTAGRPQLRCSKFSTPPRQERPESAHDRRLGNPSSPPRIAPGP
jgi:PadR family transcriptional regulator, regulatory protein PadR